MTQHMKKMKVNRGLSRPTLLFLKLWKRMSQN